MVRISENLLAASISNQSPASLDVGIEPTTELVVALVEELGFWILLQVGFGNEKAVAAIQVLRQLWRIRLA